MANLTMNLTDKLIFNNNTPTGTADTYLTAPANDTLQSFLKGTQYESVQVFGTSGSSNRAVLVKYNGTASCAIPLDLTSAAIQQAIDNLPQPPGPPVAGGVVFLPSGTYVVSSTIKYRDNIIIQGCGSSTILNPSSALTTAILQTDSTAAQRANIFLRDFVVDNLSSTTAGGRVPSLMEIPERASKTVSS